MGSAAARETFLAAAGPARDIATPAFLFNPCPFAVKLTPAQAADRQEEGQEEGGHDGGRHSCNPQRALQIDAAVVGLVRAHVAKELEQTRARVSEAALKTGTAVSIGLIAVQA